MSILLFYQSLQMASSQFVCNFRILAEKRKQEDYEESEADAVRQTALDMEDRWDAEFRTFTPSDKVTGKNIW